MPIGWAWRHDYLSVDELSFLVRLREAEELGLGHERCSGHRHDSRILAPRRCGERSAGSLRHPAVGRAAWCAAGRYAAVGRELLAVAEEGVLLLVLGQLHGDLAVGEGVGAGLHGDEA